MPPLLPLVLPTKLLVLEFIWLSKLLFKLELLLFGLLFKILLALELELEELFGVKCVKFVLVVLLCVELVGDDDDIDDEEFNIDEVLVFVNDCTKYIKSFSFVIKVNDLIIFVSMAGTLSLNRISSNLPVVNNTIAFKQEYSAESTCKAFNFSTCSWKILMWSINATTRSAAIGDACKPAAANSGATCSGIEHCDAFNTNNSDHTNLNNATWSVTCRSGKNGIFLAHSTAENNNLAANSHILSIPIMLFVCIHWP